MGVKDKVKGAAAATGKKVTKTVTKRLFKKRTERAASEILEEAVEHHQADYVSLDELLYALHERGFGLLLLIFALPNCVPIPVPPGVSSVFSIPLLFLSAQMIYGLDHPWLPQWLEKKKVKRRFLANIISKASPRLKRIEKILRPRWSFASTQTGERLIGIMSFGFAISIAVPLPWTNFVPGVGILIMSMGLLSRDGVVIGIGALVGVIGCCITASILILGFGAVSAVLGLG